MTALSPKAIQRIQVAIKRFKNWLKFSNIGPQSLTIAELKDLARAGYIGKGASPRTAIADSYLATHLHTSDEVSGAPKTIKEGSISYLERMAALYSDKAADELGADIVSTLTTEFLPFFNREEGKAVYDVLKDPQNRGKYLGSILHGKVKNWRQRYDLIVKTESVRSANIGALDAILHNNKSKDSNEIIVYKTGINDRASSCDHCKKFWFNDDGTPKIYRLQELLNNGSNLGKKAKAWTATCDVTHPRCVHYLQELKNGYSLKSGKPEYVSPDYRELPE